MSQNTGFPARSFFYFVLIVVAGLAVVWSTKKTSPLPDMSPLPTQSSLQVVYSRTIGSAPTPSATLVTYRDEGIIVYQTKNLSTNRFTRTVEETLTEADRTSFEAMVRSANPVSFQATYRCQQCPEDLPTERLTFYLETGNKTIELYEPEEANLPLGLSAILEQMKTWEQKLTATE